MTENQPSEEMLKAFEWLDELNREHPDQVVTTYAYGGGHLVRNVEKIVGGYFLPDGGYVPQTVVEHTETVVKPTDADFEEAQQYANDLEEARRMNYYG